MVVSRQANVLRSLASYSLLTSANLFYDDEYSLSQNGVAAGSYACGRGIYF
ncbi:sugar transporter [Cronobacter turicensis]|uniref:Sugar transporter n=1 Tax=Cronobacter turicensis TaxID=413502 RepID=A0A2T7AZS8_9ENTR|nr:sugar transporter [Cronobacter turicensis]EGT5680353.1 sugar transporter [Cronobacter turicensis]EGT5738550.1 sugar transporter [Cronobacter turicensis]NCH21678.1 sugar transporter [Cronobacter turicensis]PUX18212.1 sugar transporter [Cronobacter turicensis]